MPNETSIPVVDREAVLAARERIGGRVRRTPVLEPGPGAFGLDTPVVLKLELLQHTGSFKPRGAFNRMLAAEVPASGVIAASGGNFGLGVAYAARELGHAAEVFVPETSPPVKAERIRAQGAEVRLIPGYYADALEACERRAAEAGALFMHAYDQPEVVAGQGTIGAELSEQVPDADTILVAVGGGGLIGGIAAWFASDVRVIGVEPAACPTLTDALAAGKPVDAPVGGVAADSLGPRRAGVIATEIAKKHVDHVVLVPDETIVEAQRRLWNDARVIAEPGGAAALAALVSGGYRSDAGERVVVLVCGANTDPASVTR
ncbi:MAG: threonine/serine dehydratase [Actinomycetota bacterium]